MSVQIARVCHHYLLRACIIVLSHSNADNPLPLESARAVTNLNPWSLNRSRDTTSYIDIIDVVSLKGLISGDNDYHFAEYLLERLPSCSNNRAHSVSPINYITWKPLSGLGK